MGLAGMKEAAELEGYTDRIVAAIEADQMELAFRVRLAKQGEWNVRAPVQAASRDRCQW